jgi:BMFP domain-containing protein YqiC
MQTQNPILDDIARLMTTAVGAAQGLGEEARTFLRGQAERLIADMDLVSRDDFEAMKQLAQSARMEADAAKARLDALETRLAALEQQR